MGMQEMAPAQCEMIHRIDVESTSIFWSECRGFHVEFRSMEVIYVISTNRFALGDRRQQQLLAISCYHAPGTVLPNDRICVNLINTAASNLPSFVVLTFRLEAFLGPPRLPAHTNLNVTSYFSAS